MRNEQIIHDLMDFNPEKPTRLKKKPKHESQEVQVYEAINSDSHRSRVGDSKSLR